MTGNEREKRKTSDNFFLGNEDGMDVCFSWFSSSSFAYMSEFLLQRMCASLNVKMTVQTVTSAVFNMFMGFSGRTQATVAYRAISSPLVFAVFTWRNKTNAHTYQITEKRIIIEDKGECTEL